MLVTINLFQRINNLILQYLLHTIKNIKSSAGYNNKKKIYFN